MRRFHLLVLRRLTRAPLRTAVTVLALAAGVSLAVSISVLLTSVDASLNDFGSRLAGPAELRITGATLRGALPMEAIDTAARVPGVAAVVPMVQAVAPVQSSLRGPIEPTLVLGVDCQVERLLGPFGCDPAALAAADGPIAAGPGVRVGPDAVLRTDIGRVSLDGTPVVGRLGRIGDGNVVILPMEVAQRLFTRPGQVDVAYVMVTPGADLAEVRTTLQAALGTHLPVVAAADPPAGADAILGAAVPIYSLLGIFALGIGGVLVANTAAMSLEGRRRELAMLGALGGRPGTLLRTTIAEMLVLGAAGGAVGTLGGVIVASPIVASLSSFTESQAGVPLSVHASGGTLVTGLLLGMGLGAGSALLPARRASRRDIATELSGREAADQTRPAHLWRRALLWSGIVALGLAGCWAASQDGSLAPWQSVVITPAFLLVTLGTLFMAAAVAPMIVGRLAAAAARIPYAPLRVALVAARRDHRRTGMLAVAVSAAVVTAFVTAGASASARTSIKAAFVEGGAGVDITTVPAGEGFGAYVPPDLVASLADLSGVQEVTFGSFVVAGRGSTLIAVSAGQNTRLTNDVIDGVADLTRLDAGEVLIGAGLARRQRIKPGDSVELTTPSGTRVLPVQGVWEDGNNAGANITMSPALLEELFGPQPLAFVTLRPAKGVSEALLAQRVMDAHLDPSLRTRPSARVATDIADEVDAQFASFRVMQQALLAVLFVAVLSSLLLAGVQRQRELGLLTAVGADPSSLLRTILIEAGLVGAIGVAISIVVGPIMMWSLGQAMPFIIGFRNELTLNWMSLVTSGAAAIAVVLLGAAWPARRAARVEVLDALRYE